MIHQYKNNGYNIVLDVNSGSIHVVDDCVYDAIPVVEEVLSRELKEEEYMNAAKEAFSEYLTNTSLDSRQIYFVNQIIEYIVHNGMLKDLSVLQESPFTDQGSVVEIFKDMTVWMGIRKVIDSINANAVA